jgi:hypothetical protein
MLVLTDTQKCTLTITVVDAKGHPAQIDGVPAWSSSNEATASVNVSADGLSATVVAGDPGTAQINVTADADLGAGVKPIAGTLDVEVIAGEAAAVAISTGTPEEQE